MRHGHHGHDRHDLGHLTHHLAARLRTLGDVLLGATQAGMHGGVRFLLTLRAQGTRRGVRLLQAVRRSWLYRAANTNPLTQVLSVVLVVAVLASAMYPLLLFLAPTRHIGASPQISQAQAASANSANAAQRLAAPVDVCQLYPIALHTSSLAGIAVGGTIANIYNGTAPGNFGWLSWTSDMSETTLVTSLTPPGDSTSYINPNNASDHVLVVGDWVDGRPGVANSKAVHDALTQLESQDIVVPVWDQTQGQGSTTQYHVAGFAQLRITGFQLPGANTISARYLGSTDCLGTPPPPPPPPPAPFSGATLTLSPATAGPNVTSTTQTLQASLTSRTGTPLSGVSIQFTLTGANPTTFSGTTDANGLLTFTYAGANSGTDTAQATATDSSGATLTSNSATVYWVKPLQTVSTSTIWARVFPPDARVDGVFSATPAMTPLFTEAFPTIDFNPPGGTIPGNTSGVNEGSRPMVDVTTDLNGNYSGTIVLQGNGYQAGANVDPQHNLPFFDVVFTGTFTAAAAGQVTFNLFTDDGFVLGVGSDAAGDAATRVGGPMVNPPPSGATNFMHFPVMGSYNQGTPPVGNDVTVSFPAAGTYPYELDYSEGVCCTLVVTATTVTASGTQGIPPTGSLVLSPNTVASQVAGGQQTFTVLATDAGGAAQTNLPVQLTVVGANAQQLHATTDATGHASFTYTGTYAGTDSVQAVAWVSGLASYSGQVTFQWTPGTTPPPTPQTVTQGWIGAPKSQTLVSGQVPITLASNVTLASGTVSYWPANNPNATTTLASNVTGSGGATLATLDTTTISDGTYVLALNGTDSAGNRLNSEVLITVVGQNKPGRVTFSVTDLTVPVAGIPITVGRTYDSLLRSQVGDFGNGWALSIGHPQLTTDPAHDVTLTLADGRRATFSFTPQSTGGLFGFLLTPGYTPEPGVYGSLTSDGCGLLVMSGGQFVCFLDAQYAPTTYKYTDPYGRVYTLGADGGLKSIADLNGNELVFGPTGITSSAGNSVSFARDSAGRITKISDPAGNLYQYSYDGNGNLISVGLPGVNTPIQYTYDTSHLLLSAVDPRGNSSATTTYDASGRLASVTDALGNKTTFAYDLSTNITTITAPDGGVTANTYDMSGSLVSHTNPLGHTTTYTYDSNHNLTTMVDPLGRKIAYSYDGQGNQTSITNPLGHTTLVAYNQFGEPTKITDQLGNSRTIQYDANFNPVTVSDSLGVRISFTYNSHGQPLTQTDGDGKVTTFTYDAFGNLLSQTDAAGRTTSYTYDTLGNRLTYRDALGNTAKYTYDALGHLLTVTDPVGHVTQYTYDPDGNQLTAVDALGRNTGYTYDAMNRLDSTTFPDGSKTSSTFDFRGNPLTTTDQAGHVTAYVYDLDGQQSSVTTASGTGYAATTSYAYDVAGQQVKLTDPLGDSTDTTYDAAGQTLTITDPLGLVTKFTYDASGQPLSVTDPGGHVTSYTYDARGQLAQTTFADGTSIQQSYDGAGHVLSRTDQNGLVTTYTYDAVGRVLSVTDPLNQATTYTYDSNGNLLSITDANGHQTSFAYDTLNQQVKKTLPDGSFETYGYDAVGNQISQQLTDGHTNTTTYDALNRPSKVSYFDGTGVSYSYTATGQQATVVDARGTTDYAYDGQDRVVKITAPDGQSITYSYDANGNRTAMALAEGTVSVGSTTYAYDKDNRLVSAGATNAGTISFGYDAAGNQTQRTLPNGIAITYGFDAVNRLTSVSEQQGSTMLASYAYTLDAKGQRTQVVQADGSKTIWTYDNASRLVGEAQFAASGTETAQASYTYDAVGNRTSLASGGQTTIYSYNSLDELTSTSGAQSSQFTYDGRGNLLKTTSGTSSATYTYDAADRMTGATLSGGASVSYGYDADGRQVSQTIGGSTTNYLWDELSPNGDVVLESDASSGAIQANYMLDSQGSLLAQTRGSSTSYVLPDGQGSVRALANSSGAITDRYSYDAFGNLISTQGTTTSSYRYDGQRQDGITGLYQLRARNYDPTSGRFLSADTADFTPGDPIGLNRYLYASSNPINVIDPTGHDDLVEEGELESQIVTKDEQAAQQLGLQTGFTDAVSTAHILAALARLFEALATIIANRILTNITGPLPALGETGVGLGMYVSPGGIIQRIAALNDVGLQARRGLIPATIKYYAILLLLLQAAGYRIVHRPNFELTKRGAGGAHEERWLVIALEEANAEQTIVPESFPVIGVSQATICGTCLSTVFGLPDLARSVLPYTGCVLDLEKKIYVAASGWADPPNEALPQPEQNCALLVAAG